MNLGVHSSVYSHCYQQIIHAKFKLTIKNLNKFFYPSPYERDVWHYQDANNDLIQQSISQFSWERGFSNKGGNKQISIFNKIILDIKTKFIPHETKIFKHWERLGINNQVELIIQEKNKICELYLKNKSTMSATKLETLQNLIYKTLESCKSK